MVKLRLLEETDDFMLVEVVGEDQSIVGLLTETLNNQEGIQYAGYRVEHPLTGVITVSIKVDPKKTSARDALKKAFNELKNLVNVLEDKTKGLR